jgi:hypothetical protein
MKVIILGKLARRGSETQGTIGVAEKAVRTGD